MSISNSFGGAHPLPKVPLVKTRTCGTGAVLPEGEPVVDSAVRTATQTRPGRPRRRDDWRASYSRRLALTDSLVVLWAVTGTQLIWFSIDAANGTRPPGQLVLNYTLSTLCTAIVWLASLRWLGT